MEIIFKSYSGVEKYNFSKACSMRCVKQDMNFIIFIFNQLEILIWDSQQSHGEAEFSQENTSQSNCEQFSDFGIGPICNDQTTFSTHHLIPFDFTINDYKDYILLSGCHCEVDTWFC